MFVDRAEIAVWAGDGGRGVVAFRREKYEPLGGPSGGDGGRGGSVWLRGDPELATLLSFQHRREFRAAAGEAGSSQKRHGAGAPDLELAVPLGTEVRERGSGEALGDVLVAGQRLLVARGGRGGRGNARFSSSVRQAPRFAERGEAGQEVALALELRVLADVGLVGMPNAGKSTVLAAISAARPKIAPYPFTTLQPQLGVVRRGERELVLADIPGLIEGAHAGHGLGNDFLRHVGRCRLLVQVVDVAGVEGRDPVADYELVQRELRLHSPELAERPRVVVGNKADLPAFADGWARLRAALPAATPAFAVSAAQRQGTDELAEWLLGRIAALPPRLPLTPTPPEGPPVVSPRGMVGVEVEAPGRFRVRGEAVERVVSMADLDNAEAVDYLYGRLLRLGVPARWRRAGAGEGDVVRIGAWSFRLGGDGLPLLPGGRGGEAAGEGEPE